MAEPIRADVTRAPPAPALSYAPPPPPPPSVLAAVVLAAPGALCWLMLGWVVLGRFLPSGLARAEAVMMWVGPWRVVGAILASWGVALVAAAVSLALYARLRPKPWYVRVNLAINAAGLLFTLGVAALFLILRA